MIDKIELSEEDVKAKYINPSLLASGWSEEQIRREVFFTAGRINIKEGKSIRGKGKRADYVLNYKSNMPLAIIEAKNNTLPMSFGIQQGIEYAEILDVPFAYSSNGNGYTEFDRLTGKQRDIKMSEFPTPEDLWNRFLNVKSIDDGAKKIISESYFYTRDRIPRYYQCVAINRTIEAIAKKQERILLVMATGTGKTYTAFQIAYRLWKSGAKKRILFLADRNILIDQTMANDFKHFDDKMIKINRKGISKAHEIFLGLYQSMTGAEEFQQIYREFSPDFFDLIIIDECHRGSAKEDSAWRVILEYFSSATQIGMTATPKETTTVSNVDYFGEPIYTYSLKQGIEDGFLAPYRVIRYGMDKDLMGFRPYKGQVDREGVLIDDKEYTGKDFDKTIVLSKRTERVAKTISDYMRKENDRYMKTIVFCENIEHADNMRACLINENSDLVKINSKYVMKITGDDKEGKAELDNFIDSKSKYPVIATTSKLMTTGVDSKTCKLIVLDSNITSMTEFKQIIGRGTRIDEEYNKTWFTIMDFRGVSSLFADPEFDGEPLQDDNFNPGGICDIEDVDLIFDDRESTDSEVSEEQIKDVLIDKPKKFYVDDVEVTVINEIVQYIGLDGKLTIKSFKDYSKKTLQKEYKSLDSFLDVWNKFERRKDIIESLEKKGIDFELLKDEIGVEDIDEFDIICHLAFDKKPLTRRQKVDKAKNSNYLKKYSGEAREILETLLDRYADGDSNALKDMKTLKLAQFQKYGSLNGVIKFFGDKTAYIEATNNLEKEFYI